MADTDINLEKQHLKRYHDLQCALRQCNPTSYTSEKLLRWVTAQDRRLPALFLNMTINQILSYPYERLQKTRGVGIKKMDILLNLLARALTQQPTDVPERDDSPLVFFTKINLDETLEPHLDAAIITDESWNLWRKSILDANTEDFTIGFVARRLCDCTRVLWNVPLKRYCPLTLEALRALPAHGEKRITAVLEAFHDVSRQIMHGHISPCEFFTLREVKDLNLWTQRLLHGEVEPSSARIKEFFIRPLLSILEHDGTQLMTNFAKLRLNRIQHNVQNAALHLGITRSRAYQLINEISDIILVRWPDASKIIPLMINYYHQRTHSQDTSAMKFLTPEDLTMFHVVRKTFFSWS